MSTKVRDQLRAALKRIEEGKVDEMEDDAPEVDLEVEVGGEDEAPAEVPADLDVRVAGLEDMMKQIFQAVTGDVDAITDIDPDGDGDETTADDLGEAAAEDITGESPDSLSLKVFNVKDLYDMRHDGGLMKELSRRFKFTKDQEAKLKADLADDKEEMENEGYTPKTFTEEEGDEPETLVIGAAEPEDVAAADAGEMDDEIEIVDLDDLEDEVEVAPESEEAPEDEVEVEVDVEVEEPDLEESAEVSEDFGAFSDYLSSGSLYNTMTRDAVVAKNLGNGRDLRLSLSRDKDSFSPEVRVEIKGGKVVAVTVFKDAEFGIDGSDLFSDMESKFKGTDVWAVKKATVVEESKKDDVEVEEDLDDEDLGEGVIAALTFGPLTNPVWADRVNALIGDEVKAY